MTSKLGRRFHLAMMVFWGLNLVAVWFVPGPLRIPYLMVVSIYANLASHWSGWSSERPVELEKDM